MPPAGPNTPYNAGWYRRWAFLMLLTANIACILLPFIGPFFRPIFVDTEKEGVATTHERISACLTVLISLTLPSISCFQFYARSWPLLDKEKIPRWQGRTLYGIVFTMLVVAVGGMLHATLLASYTKKPPPNVPIEAYRSPEISLEAQTLYWFTGVSVLLVLAFIFHLMPTDSLNPSDRDRNETGAS